MSTYVERAIPCPHCGVETVRTVAESLHGPRVPDVVKALEDGTFQQFDCEACGGPYMVDGPFVFLDFEAGLWIMCFPLDWEHAWKALEAHAEQTFHTNMFEYAPRVARRMGEGITMRTVFGLPAFREKLLCAREGVDDRVLETWKLDLARNRPEKHPLHADTRPRITQLSMFNMHYVVPTGGNTFDSWNALRASLDRIERNRAEWSAGIETLGAGSYVDTGRLLIDGDHPAPGVSLPPPTETRTGWGVTV
jgi:hypothetical protein